MRWRASMGEPHYKSVEVFLRDMRAGTFQSDYRLSEGVFLGLVEMVNQDATFAREIMDNGVLLAVSTKSGSEIDGLLALAEVCAGKSGE
jgi:hypothetical protein